jgi:hypothetical protein
MKRMIKVNQDQTSLLTGKNSIATILSLPDHSSQSKDLIVQKCDENELIFKGIIISVSSYDMLSPFAKLFRPKQSVLGFWSRKRKVTLEIGKL